MSYTVHNNSSYLGHKEENGQNGHNHFNDGQSDSFKKTRHTRLEKGLLLFAVVLAVLVTGFKKSTHTRLEKGLLLLAVVLAVLVTGLVIALVIQSTRTHETDEICETTDCAMAAARVLESVDLTADPCDDFYQFACGGWKIKNVIPEDKSTQTVFSVLRDNVQVIIKYLLEDSTRYNDIEAIEKAKGLYQSCIDEDRIEYKNQSVALPLLQELGGWPILGSNPGGNWNESQFDLATLLKKLNTYNNKPMIEVYVASDVKNSDYYTIYMDRPSFGLPGRLYYLNNDTNTVNMREAYVTLGRSVAELFGADPTSSDSDMRDVLELEIHLASISMADEDRRDNEKLYNKMNISQLDANFTSSSDPIPFRYLNYLQQLMMTDGVEIPVNETEAVVVRDVPYYMKLASVLGNYSKRTIANYLVWYIMKNRANNLPSRFRDLITDYNQVIFGTMTARARWRNCQNYAVGQMGMAIGHMFVQETFDESAKSVALDMIDNIKEAFYVILDELDWMDAPTKVLARDKADAMREWIGYPEDVLDIEELNKLYENVTINSTEYFENVLGNLRRAAADGLKNLRKKYDKNVWTTPPSTVNAFYNPVLNIIMFPAGVLQPPFYSKGQPKSMNFGGIGMVIGHEITHGFDDRGRQYDKEGNLVDWWDEAVINRFKEKAQCIVEQYSGFQVPGTDLNVNGINTQGENIADNGGLKQSFRAYRKWVDSQGKEEPRLPGVNFTHNQLFFLNFAQIWCNNMRMEAAISSINTGVHSPGQFRVIGSLRNSEEFASAFSCSKDKYMNPKDKCYVW